MMEEDKSGRETGPVGSPPQAAASRFVGPILWSLFACLVVAGGWVFLQACGLDALGLNYCPIRANRSELVREAAVGEDLARQVHMAQLAVAEAPVCARPPPQPAAAPPPPPTPATAPPPEPPVAAPQKDESEAIDRTVVERGGRNGSLQFTLEWATLDDLDLNVDCPGGRIDSQPGHSGPGICGDGRKDIDANRNLTDNVSSSPIENMVWQDDVPAGNYRIEVIAFKAAAAAGTTVPFTLRIRWRGQERICRSTVSTLPESVREVEDGKLIGGTEQLLSWRLSDDLPGCDFEAAKTIRFTGRLK